MQVQKYNGAYEWYKNFVLANKNVSKFVND